MLDEHIIIYRGTSKEEYESQKLGQSWSLDKNIAEKFAFEYYKLHQNHKNTLRVVLSTEISKKAIFYYKNKGKEKEIIVNPNFLLKDNIVILSEKILK